MITAIYIPSHTELADAAALAAEKGMALWTDGQRSVIARRKPGKGLWAQVAVKIKTPAEATPCAA